jgi:hypothetical protein
MRCIFALLLCIAIPSVVFAADAQSGYKVTYDGGSLADTKVGSGLKLVINSSTVTFLQDKSERVNIPASAITEISYGQDVHRRVGTAVTLCTPLSPTLSQSTRKGSGTRRIGWGYARTAGTAARFGRISPMRRICAPTPRNFSSMFSYPRSMW